MTNALQNSWVIDWAPLIEWNDFYILTGAAALLLLISLFVYKKSRITRLFACGVFLLTFANPSIVEEQRKSVPDIALVISDTSPSQASDERQTKTQQALEHIRKELAQYDNLQVRYINAPAEQSALVTQTELFQAIEDGYRDVPQSRRAGVIMLTDGQIHDVPTQLSSENEYGPVHALITGNRDEKDRQILLKQAPAYGIVGKNVTIEYVIEDTDNISEEYATVTITENNKQPQHSLVKIGQPQSVSFHLEHTGQNVIHFKTQSIKGEITTANNEFPIVINGVRDRLKVLLVSGRPHTGGRTWRDLLTSDPGVDLVHFTILREPSKQDRTPQHELSLIAFPFRELFEVKLYDFDLIIFDRYNLKRILPSFYFSNIARYVQEGGAFLEVSGPEFASDNSIYSTPLRNIIPATPDGNVLNGAFKPAITELGHRHPVTQNLYLSGSNKTQDTATEPEWGPWFRQVSTSASRGHIIMSGINEQPLLILDRIGKGRSAQLTSDQIWLWSRGFDGGGPQLELLRRLAHWLMKEPELEENALNAYIKDEELIIHRRSLDDKSVDVQLSIPNQETRTLTLEYNKELGLLESRIPLTTPGIHAVSDGNSQAFAIAGELNPKEFQEVIATQEKIKPVSDQSKGHIFWLSELDNPSVRYVSSRHDYGGRNWMGLKKNNSFVISGVKHRPLFPSWIYALLLIGVIIGGWWYEGRSDT